MNIVRDNLANELNEYRLKMLGESDPVDDVATEAVIAKFKIKAARMLLADLEQTRVNFARDITPFLPAPPQPLHVENYQPDERLGQVAEWMAARDRGRSYE